MQRAPDEFAAYSLEIVSALAIAGQRKDSANGYARGAHKSWHR